ncbi:MAG: U32 family peptidase [Caldilineaceae bacterium]|nr:U32 family peptidase [Caldilineaceae bacterium]MCB9160049.1 U32 family peptidase [Caldilineaceae bacterium]
MQETRAFLESLGLPGADRYDLPSSPKRFPDGAQYRVEIPSVEGPSALSAVLYEAQSRDVPVHRISQGSGIMLLTDREIREMVTIGAQAQIEVSLFVGPRAAWETGSQVLTAAGKNLGARHRGMDQLVYAVEDVKRACALGIRSVLVADEGLLWVLGEMRGQGVLPPDLVIKVSVQMGAANPAAILLQQRLGAGTYNVPTDLDLPKLAAIRAAVDIPLDIYVEVPDNFGGFIRHYEIAEIIRVAAPVYIKFGLRNAPDVYPSGSHLESTVVALSRERVRRAEIGLAHLHRYGPEAVISAPGAADLGIPQPGGA